MTASELRQRARARAEAEAELEREEIEAHLALSPGDRLLRTLELSAAHLAAFPPDPHGADDEAEVWRRVHAYLQSLDR